jgi:SAM-dependent methyltransferase
VDQFYEKAGSLFVDAYDAFYSGSEPHIAGDVAFYERVAREFGGEAGGPVLELACGTGRITLPLAKAGLHVTGVDRSEAMLTIARRKLAALPASVQERLNFVNQDMSALDLGGRFGFVFVPFRSFQALLTIDLQRKSLEAIRRHLEPTGRLALHLFDPRLDLLINANVRLPGLSGTHPQTGRRYVGEILRTDLDHLNQVRRGSLAIRRNRAQRRDACRGHSRDGAALDLSLGAASSAQPLWFCSRGGVQRFCRVRAGVWQGIDRRCAHCLTPPNVSSWHISDTGR